MAREATLKQKQFAKEYVDTKGNGTQSALKVYDTEDNNTANNIASDNLLKPTVRQEIAKLLPKNIDVLMSNVISNGLEATAQSSFEGEVMESSLPDYGERRKMASLVADIAGYKAPKQVEKRSVSVSIELDDKTPDELKLLLQQELSAL